MSVRDEQDRSTISIKIDVEGRVGWSWVGYA